MRLLILIAACLFLLNVVLFLWPDHRVSAAHVYAERNAVNVETLTLNKEMEQRYVQMDTPEKNTELSANECYRLGPFMHKDNFDLAQAVLFNAGVSFDARTRPSRESNVFRVFLGPYNNRSAVVESRLELKNKQVNDHFVRKIAENEYIISLGIYTTEATAQRAKTSLSSKLNDIQIKQELLILPDSHWLHFVLPENDQVHSQLVGVDWGETSARLGQYACDNKTQAS